MARDLEHALASLREADGTGPDLMVSDLRVCARDGRTVLRVGSLGLECGEALGIRGPSGAGKSTFLHALAGLLRLDDGSVRWGGEDLSRLGPAGRDAFRRRMIGLVFQDSHLFEEMDALENAAIAASFAPRSERAAIRARAEALLARLGVDPARRDVARMSGGERQRIAFARALSGDPPILLADEPTASLDRAAADALIAELAALAGEGRRTVIIVSHDPAAIEAMGRAVEIVDGRLRG